MVPTGGLAIAFAGVPSGVAAAPVMNTLFGAPPVIIRLQKESFNGLARRAIDVMAIQVNCIATATVTVTRVMVAAR